MGNTASASSDLRKLNPLNPLDHVRLLWWFFLKPAPLREYRRRLGRQAVQEVGAWLTSTLIWLPIGVLLLAIQMGAMPVLTQTFPLWGLAAAVLLGWLITGLMGSHEPNLEAEWRVAFGEVFTAAFVMVFGISFGIAFGTAFVVGLDMADIVAFGEVFGKGNIVALVAIFGVAFGMAFVVADNVAFGGIFVVSPVIAAMAALIGVFGIGFVGVFFAMFIIIFGLAFIAAFVTAFVIVQLIANRIERRTNSLLERALRITGLVMLISAHAALIWLTLLGGWKLLA